MTEQELKSQFKFPREVTEYIKSKTETNGSGGRPHFLKQISETQDARNVVLEICERSWVKAKNVGSTAKKYKTDYKTIWRILQDLSPWKQDLVTFIEQVPRRKVWYNKEMETSDYETVQAYVTRATDPFDPVKSYRYVLSMTRKCWTFLKYKDPSRWTKADVQAFLATIKEGGQSGYLDCIRQVAPQIRDKDNKNYIKTSVVREKLKIRKKDIFGKEVQMITACLEDKQVGLYFHSTIFEFHVTGAFREGKDGKSGITGISWERFKKGFTRVDDFESKAKTGIWWRNCPVDLFWKDLPKKLKEVWIDRGRPVKGKVVLSGYYGLSKIYSEIRKALARYYKDKIDPDLYKEFTTLRPHDADKIHVNMLWEAGVPLEVVGGKYLGRGEAQGLVGRGWLDINIIKKHYLSLAARSEAFKKIIAKVEIYSAKHFGTKISEIALQSCILCEESFKTNNALFKHIQQKHPEVIINTFKSYCLGTA